MRKLMLGFVLFWVTVFMLIPSKVSAEEVVYDGQKYTVIEPYEYSFKFGGNKVKAGERYVIEGDAWMVIGDKIYLLDISYPFVLEEPFKLESGNKVKVVIYAVIQSRATPSGYVDTTAEVVKLVRK